MAATVNATICSCIGSALQYNMETAPGALLDRGVAKRVPLVAQDSINTVMADRPSRATPAGIEA